MNKAEQLIACLEGEIAKRDAELAACRVAVENCELFRARIAELEHRCGMYGLELTNEVERRLQAERQLSALKAQEPVAWVRKYEDRIHSHVDWHRSVLDLIPEGTKLYAAPVAKPQVVMPDPYGWVAAGIFYTERESAICDAGKTPCIEVYSRNQINALENRSLQRQEVAEELARQLSASCAEIRNLRSLNADPVQQPKCKTCDDNGRIGGPSFYAPDEGGDPCPDCCAPVQQVSVPDVSAMARTLADRSADACNVNREDNWAIHGQDYIDDVTAMLAAAPAAPAADAGLVEALELAANRLDRLALEHDEFWRGYATMWVREARAALAAHSAKGAV